MVSIQEIQDAANTVQKKNMCIYQFLYDIMLSSLDQQDDIRIEFQNYLEFYRKCQHVDSSETKIDTNDDRKEWLKILFINELERNKRLIQFIHLCQEELGDTVSMGNKVPLCSLDIINQDFPGILRIQPLEFLPLTELCSQICEHCNLSQDTKMTELYDAIDLENRNLTLGKSIAKEELVESELISQLSPTFSTNSNPFALNTSQANILSPLDVVVITSNGVSQKSECELPNTIPKDINAVVMMSVSDIDIDFSISSSPSSCSRNTCELIKAIDSLLSAQETPNNTSQTDFQKDIRTVANDETAKDVVPKVHKETSPAINIVSTEHSLINVPEGVFEHNISINSTVVSSTETLHRSDIWTQKSDKSKNTKQKDNTDYVAMEISTLVVENMAIQMENCVLASDVPTGLITGISTSEPTDTQTSHSGSLVIVRSTVSTSATDLSPCTCAKYDKTNILAVQARSPNKPMTAPTQSAKVKLQNVPIKPQDELKTAARRIFHATKRLVKFSVDKLIEEPITSHTNINFSSSFGHHTAARTCTSTRSVECLSNSMSKLVSDSRKTTSDRSLAEESATIETRCPILKTEPTTVVVDKINDTKVISIASRKLPGSPAYNADVSAKSKLIKRPELQTQSALGICSPACMRSQIVQKSSVLNSSAVLKDFLIDNRPSAKSGGPKVEFPIATNEHPFVSVVKCHKNLKRPFPFREVTEEINNKSYMLENDGNTNDADVDILDLQRIADKFANKSKSGEKIMNIKMDDLEISAKVDCLLKEAYTYLLSKTLKDKEFKKRLANLVENLNMLPHIYYPHQCEDRNKMVVQTWLNTKTSNAEPEFCGLTSLDPFEPRKYIPKFIPRASNSDTNIILGKTKKGVKIDCEISDIVGVYKSSSDTRVSCQADWVRPCIGNRRRNILNTQKRKRCAPVDFEMDIEKRCKLNININK